MKTEIELFFVAEDISKATLIQTCENIFQEDGGKISVFESTFFQQEDEETIITDGYRLVIYDMDGEKIKSLIPVFKRAFSIDKVYARVKVIEEFVV